MIKFLIFFLFFINGSKSNSSDDYLNLSEYSSQLYLGEKKIELYVGPNNPLLYFNKENFYFLDNYYYENFFNLKFQNEFFDLKKNWDLEILNNFSCSNYELSESYNYLRYLFRLLTFSYIYEDLVNINKCKTNFENIIKECLSNTSVSEDMKKFILRIESKFENQKFSISKKSFNQNENARQCKLEESFLVKICNEKDSLYGLKEIGLARNLIKKSNAFSIVNKNGNGEFCMLKFISSFERKENYGLDLKSIFERVFNRLSLENSRYKEGDLYLPGALKEFDLKGLDNFLTHLTPLKEARITKTENKIIEKKPLEVVKVELPKIEIKKTEVKKVEEIPNENIQEFISEFENSLLEMSEKDFQSYRLNMFKFNEEFAFTKEVLEELTKTLAEYQTQNALADMKSLDLLGSKEAPLSLIFVKYFLITNNHQALFNIIKVLGEKFYVVNDLEKKNVPVYIGLKLEEFKKKSKWQITIFKDSNKKGPK